MTGLAVSTALGRRPGTPLAYSRYVTISLSPSSPPWLQKTNKANAEAVREVLRSSYVMARRAPPVPEACGGGERPQGLALLCAEDVRPQGLALLCGGIGGA